MAVETRAQDDWAATWDPMIAKIGSPVADDALAWGADRIERSAVWRYLEPLEFDCALHYDRDVAVAHGYPDITAPYASVITFSIPPMWEPGVVLFSSDERDAQPAESPIDGQYLRLEPHITGFFATDIEIDFVRPPVVGERLGRRGGVLKSCVPKWTSVGRGAFLTLEAEVVTGTGEVVAKIRNTVFAYEPVGPPPAWATGGDLS